MIKAEVIEYPGAEVPNWVAKCKEVLTSAPAFGVFCLLILTIVGLTTWHASRSVLSDNSAVQSQPVDSQSLQVLSMPTTDPISGAQTPASPNNSGSPVGPAPTTSLSSLQPTGAAQSGARSLPSTANSRALQAAGNASLDSLQNLGL